MNDPARLKVLDAELARVDAEPYYEPVGDELALFEAAYSARVPVLLKGPTGCGKTRFVEHMAWRLERPLVTVSCHDDLTASDLVTLLPKQPAIGRPGRVAGTRELVIRGLPYVVPYRVRGGDIEILRVLHASRRWPDRL